MDWKDIYNQAFPKKQPAQKYSWPKLEKPGPGEASQFAQGQLPGAGGSGKWPELKKPGAGAGGEGFAMAVGANKAPEGGQFPNLPNEKMPSNDMPQMRAADHIGAFGFRVEIEGLDVGGFTRVDGLNAEVEVIEYQHSNDITPRKRMGRIKVGNVKLVKGYINDPTLYSWCQQAMKGDIQRKSMSVVLLDDSRTQEISRYNLFEVWPTKWSGFKLTSTKGVGALVEEIELVVEHIDRA